MARYHEYFAEQRQTEWRGARVRVAIELPEGYSMTSQLVIDDRQLHDLKWLKKFPMDLPPDSDTRREWQFQRDIAMKTAAMLAEKIAYDICRAIGEQV